MRLKKLSLLRVSMLVAGLAMAVGVPSYGASAHQYASAARALSLHEIGHLRLRSRHGSNNLYESGTQSGTLGGSMSAQIVTAYTTASVNFTVNPGGGSFRGQGLVSYYVAGNTAHFNGKVTITGGTGRFAHISHSQVQVTGAMLRSNYAATLTITGRVSF